MKESLFARSQRFSDAISEITRRWTQDESGLFLGGAEVGTTKDIYDPTDSLNDDPRFMIRVVSI